MRLADGEVSVVAERVDEALTGKGKPSGGALATFSANLRTLEPRA
jgi:hypothetical protein